MYWADFPGLYLGVTWSLFLGLVGLCFLPALTTRRGNPSLSPIAAKIGSPWVFVGFIFLFLLAARWPGFFYFTAYNVDEAQILAAAQVLTIDPVFFRSAECGSSGPFVIYPLLASLLIGQEPTLFAARGIGVCMLGVCAACFYGIGRMVFSEAVARLSTMVPVTFFAFLIYWDFVHYTSEHAPQFYLWLGLYGSARIAFGNALSAKRMLIWGMSAAVCFSLVPLAKLQGTYLAVFGGILLLVAVWIRTTHRPTRERLAMVGATGGAALIIPGVMLGVFAAAGVFPYFVGSYLGNALAYQSSGLGDQTAVGLLLQLVAKTSEAQTFFLGLSFFWLISLGALLAPSVRRVPQTAVALSAVSFLFLILAVSAVTTTMRDYTHYLLFLPFFAALMTATLCGIAVQRGSGRSAHELTCLGVLFLFGVLPMAGLRWEVTNFQAGLTREWSEKQNGPQTPVGAALTRLKGSDPSARLTVWGYMPSYYVESGMKQATRLATSAGFNLPAGPLRTFFVQSFLQDFRKNQPEFFVDAVAPGQFYLTDRATHGHDQVPGMRKIIESDYQLIDEIDGVRIYRRKSGQEAAP
jgi:hypothetical protein